MHVDPENKEGKSRPERPGMSVAERTRMIATLGVMAAVSVVFLVLGTLISINTVFFTALAAFLVGIAVVRYHFAAGVMLFFGCGILDLILNPDKFHVLLYLAMAGFILLGEGSYKLLEKRIADPRRRSLIHLICRIVVFFIAYMPLAIFIPRLFLTEEAVTRFYGYEWIYWALPGVGVVAFVVYDLAYLFVKRTYMHLFRL
ncbi:MAG: hypothetical protein VZQ83_06350 [Eubacterium sp.]|nr:hypothetical protein [Eubacterium sp.]